jgi:hypothetical protein
LAQRLEFFCQDYTILLFSLKDSFVVLARVVALETMQQFEQLLRSDCGSSSRQFHNRATNHFYCL